MAARAGRFHLWAPATIEEGIEILTGVEAGQRDEAGRWPERSLFGRIEARVRAFSETLRALEPEEGARGLVAGERAAAAPR